MEEKPLPPGQTVSPMPTSDSLESAGTNVPVSSLSGAPERFPTERGLEVHAEGDAGAQAITTPTLRSVPFSRRRATIVSLVITLVVLAITGVTAALFINRGVPEQDTASRLDVPQQDVSLGDENSSLPELEGAGKALLVNGDIIARGNLEVVSGAFTSVIRTAQLTGDQELTLPDASGTICLDINNCNFATVEQIAQDTTQIDQQADQLAQQAAALAALQAQLNQIVIPPAGVTSLNNQAGDVSIQGTPNQITVSTNNGTVTLSTPQDLAAISSPTFAGLLLNGNLNVTGTVTLPLNCTGFANNGKLTTDASGQIICGDDVGGGGGGAPNNADYLVVNLNGSLTNDRAFAAGTNLTATDGGSKGNYTLSVIGNPTFSGLVTANGLNAGAGLIQGTGGLTIGGTITFSSLSNGFLEVNGSGVVSVGTIDLGVDTTGDYVMNLGALTGLSTTGNSGEGSTPTLSVLYGSTANTAVQGDTALTCASGAGNLTGGGNSVTLGAGGTCNNLNTVNNPTFSTSVTTPSLILTGAGNSGTLQVANLGQATTYTLPDPGQATATICLTTGNCAGTGGGVTTAGGTVNRLPVFTGGQTIADSWLLQNGSTLQLDTTRSLSLLGGNLSVTGNLSTSGTVTFSSLANGFLEVDGSGVVSVGTINLGTDTVGDYVANIGALTGLSTTGNSGEGSTPTLSVLYGSTPNTAVQGNTQITLNPGTNITGGGSWTLGAGGSLTVNVADSPTFAGNVVVQGGSLTLGTAANPASFILNDGDGETITLDLPDVSASYVLTLPTAVGATNQCLKAQNGTGTLFWDDCTGGAGGGLSGSGTTNRVAKFTPNGTTLGDSSLSDDGSLVTVNGNVNFAVQGTTITVGLGSTRTGSIALHNSTNNNTVTLQSGVTGTSYALTLPTAVGAANQCLKAQDGTGTLFWDGCLGGGGGGGITSIDGQTGPSIAINNATGAANVITIDDAVADGITKGIATFNSTNFTAAAGVVNTIQNIHTGATPTFAGLTLNGNLNMGANTIQGTTASIDFTNFDVLGNGNTTVGGTLAVQGASVTVGATALQGSIILNDGNGGQTGTLSVANLAANRTYTLPEYLTGTGTICLDSGNCAGTGGGVTTPGGTTNRLAVFTGTGTIGDSWFLQNGSTLELDNTRNLSLLGGNLSVTGNGSFTGNQQVDGSTILGDAATDTLTVNAASTFNTDVDMVFTDLENLSISGTLSGTTSVSVWNMSIANNTSSGTQNLALLQNAGGTGVTDGLLVLDNADADTAVSAGLVVTSSAAGGVTTAIDVSHADITNALLFGANDVIGTNFTIAGATGATTIGSSSQQGLLTLHDGNGQTATISVGSALAANTALAIPTNVGTSDTFCLLALGNCFGSGTGNTLQAAYDAGNTIATTNNRNIAFTLADTATDANFITNIASGSTGRFAVQGNGTDVLGITSTAVTVNQALTVNANTNLNGNLTITSETSGSRVISARFNSDFSGTGATTYFQNSETDQDTYLNVLANGTASISGIMFHDGSLGSGPFGVIDHDTNTSTFNIVATNEVSNAGATLQFITKPGSGGLETARLTIDPNGVTTFNPTGTDSDLRIQGDTNANLFYVDASTDRIGIGDATPAYLLTVGSGDLFGVNNSGNVIVTALGAADTATYICRNSSNQLATCNTTGTGAAFVQGGNNFGATGTLGLTSNNDLNIITNNLTRMTVLADGRVGIGQAAPDARLEVAGNISQAAWGLNGIQLQASSATYTDTGTAGTRTNTVINSFGTPTIASTNAVTSTNAATVYVQNAPAAGTNHTITNAYALWVDDGNARFDGNVGINTTTPAGRLQVVGRDNTSGTGTISSASDTVTGSGTFFTREVTVGTVIIAGGQQRTVIDIASNTTLTTDSAFSPALSGEGFTYRQPIATFTQPGNPDGENTNLLYVDREDGQAAFGLNMNFAWFGGGNGVDATSWQTFAPAGASVAIGYAGGGDSGFISGNSNALFLIEPKNTGGSVGINVGSGTIVTRNQTKAIGFNETPPDSDEAIHIRQTIPLATTVGYRLRAAASQTADILQVTTNGGGALLNLTAGGSLGLGDATPDALLDVAGSFRFDGNGIFGDASADTVTFNAEVASHIIPDVDDTYDLGSVTNRWRDVYVGPASLHVGTNGDEGTISYNTSNNTFEFNQAISTPTFRSDTATFGVASTTDGVLTLQNAANAFTVSINAPDQTVGSATISLPDTAGVDDEFCLLALNNCGSAGGVTTIGTIDSQTKSANGAVISGTSLILQTADVTFPGLVNTGTQTFAGAKTFNGVVTAAAAGTGLSVSNNASIGGNLAVTGTGTFTGDVAVNGGDLTATGALNVTPSGTLTLGVTGQAAILQGSTTTITSNGAGNDITLTSADQIMLNAASGSLFQNGSGTTVASMSNLGTLELIQNGYTTTGVSQPLLLIDGTINKDNAVESFYALHFNSTINVTANPTVFGGDTLFRDSSTRVYNTASTFSDDGGVVTFQAVPNVQATGGGASTIGSGSSTGIVGYQSDAFLSVADSSTLTVVNMYGAQLNASSVGTGVTVTNRYGARVGNGAGAGSITNQYGLYVDNLTKGTNDYGIYLGGADTADIFFATDVNHILKVQDQDTAATAGNSLSVTGANGNTSGAGGDINITSGNGGSSGTTNAGTITINNGTVNSGGTATINVGSSNTTALNLGTANVAKTINMGSVGSTAAASTVNIANSTGSGNQIVNIGAINNAGNTVLIQGGTGASAVSIQSGAAGTISVGTSAVARTVNVGTGGAVQTVVVGSTNTTSTTTIQGGSGATAVGITATSGTITVNTTSASGTINIGSTAATRTISIGNVAAVQTVTLGSTNSTSTTTVQGGSGATAVNITATSGTINVNTTSASGTINIGNTANARTVNLGTGGANQTVTVGSTNSASLTTIQGGTDGIQVTTGGGVAIGDATPDAAFDLYVADSVNNDDGSRLAFFEKELNVTSAASGPIAAPEFGVVSTFWQGVIDAGESLAGAGGGPIGVNNSWFQYELGAGSTIDDMVQGYRTDLVLSGGGTVGDYAAFAANTPDIDTTTLTNYYGLYIAPIGAEATNGFGIFQEGTGDENYFGGTIELETLGAAVGAETDICRDNTTNILRACTSLAQHKSNIQDLDMGGLNTINQLQARQFSWNGSGEADLGFIAEEVAAVNPLLGQRDATGNLTGVKYRQMSALLVKGIQELDVKVDNSLADVSSLEVANNAQNADILNLSSQSDELSGQVAGLQTQQGDTESQLTAIQNQLNSGQFSSLNVSGPSTFSSLTVTGNATINHLVVEDVIVNHSITINGHIITGNSSNATTITEAAICGTGSATIDGNDTSGTITITTGSGACAPGTLATATFANTYGATPRIILTPANADSSSLQYYNDNATTTTFTIDAASAPTASKVYKYNYQIMQ